MGFSQRRLVSVIHPCHHTVYRYNTLSVSQHNYECIATLLMHSNLTVSNQEKG